MYYRWNYVFKTSFTFSSVRSVDLVLKNTGTPVLDPIDGVGYKSVYRVCNDYLWVFKIPYLAVFSNELRSVTQILKLCSSTLLHTTDTIFHFCDFPIFRKLSQSPLSTNLKLLQSIWACEVCHKQLSVIYHGTSWKNSGLTIYYFVDFRKYSPISEQNVHIQCFDFYSISC